MAFEEDRLELQRLAGGNISKYPPVFSENGSFLFVRCVNIVQVFSSSTGELTRELTGATATIISIQLELKQPEVLVACTSEGQLLRWHWRTGVLQKSLQLQFREKCQVYSFNLLDLFSNTDAAYAWVMTKPINSNINWLVVDTTTGKRIHVPLELTLKTRLPVVDVSVGQFKYIAIGQGGYIYFINYENQFNGISWQYVRFKTPLMAHLTCIRFNPVQEQVATGDTFGKVFLWHKFNSHETMRNSLYHWHHTAITSLAYTASGTTFYSSGHESVLVKWNVNQPNMRQFLPHMNSIIRHISVSSGNEHVVVSTDDNGLQFIGASDNVLKKTLQNFTYAPEDNTGRSKFPIGLRLNPRSNTLVLNGRIGHLQFYSAYTKNLLYNLSIVDENKLSMEAEHILYNVQVSKAAFNIDWMATGEVFNDEEHLPQLSLKFWKYDDTIQRYALNTNVELPHEGGFKAIAFSNDYQVDNLLCATVGHDHVIKIWALEESDNMYRSGKIWVCIAQTQYKEMPIEDISFSQDGSLLAAGYGNTLCIYKADTLKLRAALTGSAGLDGVTAKAQVRLAKQTVNGAKNEYTEQRNKLWQLFKRVLESNDTSMVKEVQDFFKTSNELHKQTSSVPAAPKINDKSKAQIYKKISEMHELNLYQKLQLLQRFGIQCQVREQWTTRMIEYLRDTVVEREVKKRAVALNRRLHNVNIRQRYKAKYRLQHYARSKQHYDTEISNNLIPILKMLQLDQNTKAKQTNKTSKSEESKKKAIITQAKTSTNGLTSIRALAEIKHVQFAAGDYAHLVTVCTESRVLIWNLLTLRLQSVLKLSVAHLTFDAQTNLLAAVTKTNDLHVFQPNVPLPIYQRAKLPNLYGIIWLPRRYPKQRSINVDWQAQSTLYFLTEAQEIKYLAAPEAEIDLPAAPVSFGTTEAIRYATFGTFTTQQQTSKKAGTRFQTGPLIVGKGRDTAVNTLVNLSAHTMPPLSLLCGEFVQSLLKPAETAATHEATLKERRDAALSNGNGLQLNGNGTLSLDSDNDDEDDTMDHSNSKNNLKIRKTLLMKSEALAETEKHKEIDIENQLERIGQLSLLVDF